jgi:type II secretory pathway pseudopilin PulG
MTLVEVLIALAIISLGVIAVVNGLGTASVASDYHRKQVTADTVLRSYAEALKQRIRVGAYDSCPAIASSYDIPSDVWAATSGYPVRITSIKYLQSSGGSTFSTTCPSSDQGAEQLTLAATSSDARDTETLDLIVRTP